MSLFIDPAVLKTALRYNPETGQINWSPNESDFVVFGGRNGRKLGGRAFTRVTHDGYLCGDIFGRPIPAHRAVWAMTFNFWPDYIDHVNGDRRNNRLANLRSVSRTENNRNKRLSKINTTGSHGVHWHKENLVWYAVISEAGRQLHLGSFNSKSEAIHARKSAEARLGYHQNHGRLA